MLSRISVPVRLSVLYCFFAVLWIVFSGRLAEKIAAGNTQRLQEIEEYKGLFFVVLSTLLLFFVSRNMYRRIVASLEEYKVMEKKNDALITATREGIYEYNIRTDVVQFNATMRQILEIEDPLKTYQAKDFWEKHIHPDDLQRVLLQFDSAMRTGVNYWREEYRALTEKGDSRHVLHSVYILRDDWAVAYGVIGAIQDLTEFRQLEAQLHDQQLKQRTELSRSIIEAEEKERNRWAEELHDNIAQVLSVASLYAGTINSPGTDLKTVSAKIKEMLDLSVQEIRQLSANLKPPRFEDESLRDAISLLLHYIRKVKVIDFDLRIDPNAEKMLDNEQKLAAYRIIQEQVHNIIKHAEATTVSIVMAIRDSCVHVEVTDNGKGFDMLKTPKGTGLRNMASRMELLQGDLEIESGPGTGSRVVAKLRVA